MLTALHRRLLDCSFLAVGLGAPLWLVALALARRGDWPAQRFLLLYVAPTLSYGAAWARDRLATCDRAPRPLLALDALTFVAGALRAGGGWGVLPYSGHMLFLTYAALTTRGRALRLTALALVAVTSWFKLALWYDERSWALGLVGGGALAVLRALLARHRLAAA